MAQQPDKKEGGLGPLIALTGLMLLVLGYGVSRGFLTGEDKHLPDRPIQLVVAFGGGSTLTPVYQSVAHRFEKSHPDVAVQLRPIFGSKYYQKLLIMMASGHPPDLMWMGEAFGAFARRGAFLNVTKRVNQDLDTSHFVPQALDWYHINGKQFGVPFLVDMQFIVYNVDMFKKAGVPKPSASGKVWTYEQFLHDAKHLTLDYNHDGSIDRYGYFGQLVECVFGAQIISDDGTKAACNRPGMIQFLKTNLALMDKYHVTPSVHQQLHGAMNRLKMFISGQAAMIQAYTWDLPKLRKQNKVARWAIAPNPIFHNRPQATWASSQAMLVSSQTHHPDAAWELCKEFLSPKFQARMASRGLPSNLQVARSLASSGNPEYSSLDDLLNMVGHLVASPRVAHLREAQHIYVQTRQSVWIGQNTPKQAMIIAARRINRMINQQRRFGS